MEQLTPEAVVVEVGQDQIRLSPVELVVQVLSSFDINFNS
tara:strand:+ start:815 stop:934 length:120 start_codon:yes stop_codon:yes gene_type:complete